MVVSAPDVRTSVAAMTPTRWPEQGEVHLHWALLDGAGAVGGPGPVGQDHPWLSHPEVERARRFATPLLTERWVRGRLFLRAVLGDLLGVPPDRVGLRVGGAGRPEVEGLTGPADVNLSHTDQVVVLAVAAQRVGVDVEQGGRVAGRDLLRTAEVVSTASEHRDLARLVSASGADDGAAAFARLWVRKEAVLKAEGSGFLRDAREVEVGIGPVGEVGAVRVDGIEWTVRDVEVPTDLGAPRDHVAALAVGGTCQHIRSYLRV